MVTIPLYTRQQKRHWCIEQSFGLCGRGRGWDDLGEWHWNTYNIIYETSRQSRFDAWYWMLGAGALGRPRGMVWGGRWEEGSGWGTHVYLWWIHFNIWQNQYNIVKLKNKIKLKKKKEREMRVWSLILEDPLEEEMAIYSSMLAWEIPWTEEPGGLVCGVTKSRIWLSIIKHDLLFSWNSNIGCPEFLFAKPDSPKASFWIFLCQAGTETWLFCFGLPTPVLVIHRPL